MSMEKIYVSGYWRKCSGEYTTPVYHAAEVDKQIEEMRGLLREGLDIGTTVSFTAWQRKVKEILKSEG